MSITTTRWIRSVSAVIAGAMVAVAIPALVASPASAATQTISITKSGFVPMNLTIKTGDTITFANTDTAAHEVLFKADDRIHVHREAAGHPAGQVAVLHLDCRRQLPVLRSEPA